MPRVAVEKALSDVKDMLKNNGYEVVDMGNRQQQVDAMIITGQDENVMGMQGRTDGAPVINADGMTAEQVFSAVQRAVRKP